MRRNGDVRQPAVAGSFYPREKEELKAIIKLFLGRANSAERAKDVMSYVAPHAGYIYSGPVAAYTYNALAKNSNDIETFVIVGPNHTGQGKPIAISMLDWLTPLGTVRNDVELSREISNQSDILELDESAHMHEHSIEVQLPFLQSVVKDPSCVFICMGDQSYDSSKLLSNAIIKASTKLKRRMTVIASSDFDHYEPATIAKGKDMPAIEAIQSLDTLRFNRLLEESDDTACGYGPITTSALYAQSIGAKRGKLLKYANSGDATKDYASVVAYASIVFIR